MLSVSLSLRIQNVARDQQADADKLVALIQSHYGEGSVNLEDLGSLLREAGGLGAGSEEEGEWRRVMEAAAGADGKADAGDLVSALLPPNSNGRLLFLLFVALVAWLPLWGITYVSIVKVGTSYIPYVPKRNPEIQARENMGVQR